MKTIVFQWLKPNNWRGVWAHCDKMSFGIVYSFPLSRNTSYREWNVCLNSWKSQCKFDALKEVEFWFDLKSSYQKVDIIFPTELKLIEDTNNEKPLVHEI